MKIEAKEMQLVMLATLILTVSVLGFTGVAVVLPMALKTASTTGPHGLTEMLYAYTSATGNNGSAFAGLSTSPFWNVTMGVAMWLGRFGYAVPVLAIAGGLAAKPRLAPTAGTLPTHGALFVGLLIGVILILAGLQFFPALALGPIVEHFQMLQFVASPLAFSIQGKVAKWPPPLSTPARKGPCYRRAGLDALVKLDPRKARRQSRDPGHGDRRRAGDGVHHRRPRFATAQSAFTLQIAIWLWATVLFANFAESVAEGRGKAAADSLRAARVTTKAKLLSTAAWARS